MRLCRCRCIRMSTWATVTGVVGFLQSPPIESHRHLPIKNWGLGLPRRHSPSPPLPRLYKCRSHDAIEQSQIPRHPPLLRFECRLGKLSHVLKRLQKQQQLRRSGLRRRVRALPGRGWLDVRSMQTTLWPRAGVVQLDGLFPTVLCMVAPLARPCQPTPIRSGEPPRQSHLWYVFFPAEYGLIVLTALLCSSRPHRWISNSRIILPRPYCAQYPLGQ